MYKNVVKPEDMVRSAKAGPEYGVGVYRDITEWAAGDAWVGAEAG